MDRRDDGGRTVSLDTVEEITELLVLEYFKDFDPTIDGDITSTQDLNSFIEPYLNTIALKNQP